MSDKKSDKMGNSQPCSWSETYEEIKRKHDEAFVAIEQAICLEEKEKPKEAIEKYKEGIQLIDEALNVQVRCPENPDFTWEKACVMIQKIKKTRAEVLTRINCIQQSPNYPSSVPEDPPSYEEATSTQGSNHITYGELASALRDLSIDSNQSMQEEVIYTHDGVRLYFISPSGEVLQTQQPQTLNISLVEGNEPNAPKAILQIGDLVYPLVPGVSPCYRTNYGAFILPNVYATEPGSSIGIILPSEADEEVFDLLENILHGIIKQAPQEGVRTYREAPEEEDTSTWISNKIVNGAWYLSQGLIKGAEKAGELLTNNTPKIINNIEPSQTPARISPGVKKSVKIAETASSKAAKMTGFVAEKVGDATMKLGHFLAPHIQKQGTKLLTRGFNMSEQEASKKMKGALTVAAGAVEGFSTVYRGLETSASILGRNLKDNTVKIVEHKYGQPAATVTGDTFTTAGNLYETYHNSKIITPKGLAKKTAKNTGKAIVGKYSTTAKANAAVLRNLEQAGPSGIGRVNVSPNTGSGSLKKSDSSNSVDEKRG